MDAGVRAFIQSLNIFEGLCGMRVYKQYAVTLIFSVCTELCYIQAVIMFATLKSRKRRFLQTLPHAFLHSKPLHTCPIFYVSKL